MISQSGAVNKIMISYKFSGHLNSNIFVRVDSKISIFDLWREWLVPLISDRFSNTNLEAIKRTLSFVENMDECLKQLLNLGAVYKDQTRMEKEFIVDPANVIRIHLMPRRYDSNRFHFGNDVVYESKDYLIVNKPSLLPVHPTVDNCKENLLFLLRQKFGSEICCIHRLDLETTGLLLFAKNNTTQHYFHNLFARREIRKYYRAIVPTGKLPLGYQCHWMQKSKRSPKRLFVNEVLDSSTVELIITDNYPSRFPNLNIVSLELLTGKTHQIRAQLSFLGFPLPGDSLYGGSTFSSAIGETHFLLHACGLKFVDQQGVPQNFSLQPSWL